MSLDRSTDVVRAVCLVFCVYVLIGALIGSMWFVGVGR